jgi:DNA-3-methyladenine glycosylase I
MTGRSAAKDRPDAVGSSSGRPTEDDRRRCAWAETDPLLRSYHDDEWGTPVHDARRLWEMLMLEGFQAGLSWLIILRKREAFRRAFLEFDPARVARFAEEDVARLLADPGIVRSRAKIEATIAGARAYQALGASGVDFSAFVWSAVGGAPLVRSGPVLPKTVVSEQLSKQLKERGFKFVGPVVVYAWMEAVGLVDDHDPDCFRATPRGPRNGLARTPGRDRASRPRPAARPPPASRGGAGPPRRGR